MSVEEGELSDHSDQTAEENDAEPSTKSDSAKTQEPKSDSDKKQDANSDSAKTHEPKSDSAKESKPKGFNVETAEPKKVHCIDSVVSGDSTSITIDHLWNYNCKHVLMDKSVIEDEDLNRFFRFLKEGDVARRLEVLLITRENEFDYENIRKIFTGLDCMEPPDEEVMQFKFSEAVIPERLHQVPFLKIRQEGKVQVASFNAELYQFETARHQKCILKFFENQLMLFVWHPENYNVVKPKKRKNNKNWKGYPDNQKRRAKY